MNDGNDNRRSFRLKEPVLLQYEVIDDEIFAKGLDRWKIRCGKVTGLRSKAMDLDARIDELLYRVRHDAPSACDAIELLNEKLNIFLEALPEFRQSKESLTNQPAQDCELSAEGMVFRASETLAPQTKLVLRFLLISDNRFFETFCRVVRSIKTKANEGSQARHRIAVEFTGMNSTEREIIIQHLFSKQSQMLRRKRKESDSTA